MNQQEKGSKGAGPERRITVRVFESKEAWEWELLGPDGEPLEGWDLISIGCDHHGKHSLHVVFDEFVCVNAEGQPVDVQLTGVSHRPMDQKKPLPSARGHRFPHH